MHNSTVVSKEGALPTPHQVSEDTMDESMPHLVSSRDSHENSASTSLGGSPTGVVQYHWNPYIRAPRVIQHNRVDAPSTATHSSEGTARRNSNATPTVGINEPTQHDKDGHKLIWKLRSLGTDAETNRALELLSAQDKEAVLLTLLHDDALLEELVMKTRGVIVSSLFHAFNGIDKSGEEPSLSCKIPPRTPDTFLSATDQSNTSGTTTSTRTPTLPLTVDEQLAQLFECYKCHLVRYSQSPSGCIAVTRLIDSLATRSVDSPALFVSLAEAVLSSLNELMDDPYGNYVVQRFLTVGPPTTPLLSITTPKRNYNVEEHAAGPDADVLRNGPHHQEKDISIHLLPLKDFFFARFLQILTNGVIDAKGRHLNFVPRYDPQSPHDEREEAQHSFPTCSLQNCCRGRFSSHVVETFVRFAPQPISLRFLEFLKEHADAITHIAAEKYGNYVLQHALKRLAQLDSGDPEVADLQAWFLNNIPSLVENSDFSSGILRALRGLASPDDQRSSKTSGLPLRKKKER